MYSLPYRSQAIFFGTLRVSFAAFGVSLKRPFACEAAASFGSFCFYANMRNQAFRS